MTDDEKKDRVIEWLTNNHLYAFGGYPHDYEIWRGRLFVADLDDSKERRKTKIHVYKLSDLPGWYDDAADYITENFPDDARYRAEDGTLRFPDDHDYGHWSDAFYETMPD